MGAITSRTTEERTYRSCIGTASLRSGAPPQDRSRPPAKKGVVQALGLREPRVREEVQGETVLLGDPLAANADDRGGSHGNRLPEGGVEHLHVPTHQRRSGGAELEGGDHPESGVWAPEQRALPGRGPVSVRRPIALPEDPRNTG